LKKLFLKSIKNTILTINFGSSSIKFTMYQTEEILVPVLSSRMENVLIPAWALHEHPDC
jgi:acetate kinase